MGNEAHLAVLFVALSGQKVTRLQKPRRPHSERPADSLIPAEAVDQLGKRYTLSSI